MRTNWTRLSCFLLANLASMYAQGGSASAYAPRPEDAKLSRGRATVERTAVMDGVLVINGNLPTPCHEIRVKMPSAPDASGVAAIEVWSVFEAGKICTQMLAPFSVKLPLSTDLAKAKLVVNGKPAGLPTE